MTMPNSNAHFHQSCSFSSSARFGDIVLSFVADDQQFLLLAARSAASLSKSARQKQRIDTGRMT
jgi:hypothetical protein